LPAELALLGLIAVISVPVVLKVAFVRSLGTTGERWLWFSPLGHGWWFGAGMALAAVSVRLEQRTAESPMQRFLRDRPIVPWALAASLYLGLCLLLDPISGGRVSIRQYGVEYLAFGAIAALVLAPAVFEHRSGGAPRRMLANPVLAWLGLVSYGVFLWHWPILYALHEGGIGDWWPAMTFPILVVMTLAITLVCASVSYYAVERPLLRFKSSRTALRRN
jgi:peptidoglycan/LPS O-acetylase OafA/YrhL